MVIKRDILFTPAQKYRTLHIYLPEGYEASSERYPVMYFFDGHNLYFDKDATYGKSWGMKEFLDGWNKKMIVVGIECSHEGNSRLAEYCPYHIVNDFFGDLHGTGEATLQWMVDELKPLIDSEYRTYPFRESTAIGGSSMGGLMSLYAAIRFNRYFSKAACLSSAVSSCGDALTADLRANRVSPDTRVYLGWGETENYSAGIQRGIAADLDALGARTRLLCQPNGRHCEADWEKQVPGFMSFLWQEA